jgi:hypothetical protein
MLHANLELLSYKTSLNYFKLGAFFFKLSG